MGTVTRIPDPPVGRDRLRGRADFSCLTRRCPAQPSFLVLVGLVVVLPYLLMAQDHGQQTGGFQAARSDLTPGEGGPFLVEGGTALLRRALGDRDHREGRDAQGGFCSACAPARSHLRRSTSRDTSERSIGVGAYGGGLLVGTTLSSRYLELDLVNGAVVRIRADRPQVLRQRLIDAIAEWSQRQGP